MPVILVAFVLGVVSGLRAVVPLATVSWAARAGWLPLKGTKLAFLAHPTTPYVATAVALTEAVTDKLPSTPSRTVPVQFGARLASGGFAGAAVGTALDDHPDAPWVGLVAGLAGCVVGTLGGAKARARLAKAFGDDLPAALAEDVLAVSLALVALSAASTAAASNRPVRFSSARGEPFSRDLGPVTADD